MVEAAGAQIAVTVPVVAVLKSLKSATHPTFPDGYESSTSPSTVSAMLAPPPITLVPVGQAALAEVAVLVEDLTAAYNEVRFGGRRDAAPRMIWLLQRLEASRK